MFENLGSTIFFWLAWGLISYFLIQKFYFEYKENLIQRLRILALIIDLVVLIFVIMIRLMPGTITLSLREIAPILSALLLLAGNVIVLLLWHQLQLKEKE